MAVAYTWVLFVACGGHETQLPPTTGDGVPELRVSGAQIQESFVAHGGWRHSAVVAAPTGATRAGVMASLRDGHEPPVMQARGFDALGHPAPWQDLEVTWSRDTMFVARADFGLDAYGFQVRLRSAEAISHMVYSAVVPQPERAEIATTEIATTEIGRAAYALRSELSDLVRTRAEWGARATRCNQSDPVKDRIAIHHTVTEAMGDPVVNLQGVQAFHMDTRGWCDVGYHFLLTIDGQIWEARPLELQGAHVGSDNRGNIGVSHVGCFDPDSDCDPFPPRMPPPAMLDGTASIVGRLAQIYDIQINDWTVKGHRDHPTASTVCPGQHIHSQLDAIRQAAGQTGTIPAGPMLGAAYVSQSFPLASVEWAMPPGAEQEGYIEMRNTGTTTWEPSQTFLATTEPRDGVSPLAAASWPAPNRAATIESPSWPR